MRGVIERGVGGDEGEADTLRQLRQRRDAGAVVAAITVPRGEIERAWPAAPSLMC